MRASHAPIPQRSSDPEIDADPPDPRTVAEITRPPSPRRTRSYDAPACGIEARAPRPNVATRSNDVPPQVCPPTRSPPPSRTANPLALPRMLHVAPLGMRPTFVPPLRPIQRLTGPPRAPT